ncbi:hypothetical protein APX70_200097 [Pseudomonas syringae pv. maculicola]|uniref:Uncharacterized protein n=1 Tax=Pseudomonas syringae pv. maculicola TaxID=59511 RepID=A0A3M2WAP2_PSEYM|nr:hypothetical protein APX70_200097 [Pseudomonas syringae pv. maculicola]
MLRQSPGSEQQRLCLPVCNTTELIPDRLRRRGGTCLLAVHRRACRPSAGFAKPRLPRFHRPPTERQAEDDRREHRLVARLAYAEMKVRSFLALQFHQSVREGRSKPQCRGALIQDWWDRHQVPSESPSDVRCVVPESLQTASPTRVEAQFSLPRWGRRWS